MEVTRVRNQHSWSSVADVKEEMLDRVHELSDHAFSSGRANNLWSIWASIAIMVARRRRRSTHTLCALLTHIATPQP
jgi:hypothetical protein